MLGLGTIGVRITGPYLNWMGTTYSQGVQILRDNVILCLNTESLYS